MRAKDISRQGGMHTIYIFEQMDALIHIICGKLGVKVSGKGWEKRGITLSKYGEKSIGGGYPRSLKVIPKVIHSVFHAIVQRFIRKSTAPTITTTLIIINRGQVLLNSVK